MEPEGSLPCSLEPIVSSYPMLGESSPHLSTLIHSVDCRTASAGGLNSSVSIITMKMTAIWHVALWWALMMKAVSTSETWVNFYQTTWRNIAEDSHLHTHCHDNLKSHLEYHGRATRSCQKPIGRVGELQATLYLKNICPLTCTTGKLN
jgi:hypothetical protein